MIKSFFKSVLTAEYVMLTFFKIAKEGLQSYGRCINGLWTCSSKRVATVGKLIAGKKYILSTFMHMHKDLLFSSGLLLPEQLPSLQLLQQVLYISLPRTVSDVHTCEPVFVAKYHVHKKILTMQVLNQIQLIYIRTQFFVLKLSSRLVK